MVEQTRYVNKVLLGEWANPANAFADDDACTSTSTNGNENHYDFTNNPFTIPAGATITGLLMRVRWGGDGNDRFISWLKDALGVDRLSAGTPSVHGCADAVLASVGGDGDLWGGTWTPAHINSGNFICGIRYDSTGKAGTMYIDFIYVTVYYTAPPVSDSIDLKAIFEVGQDSKDLFAKFTLPSLASEDLFAKFEVGQDSKDLFATFKIPVLASKDLFAKFYVGPEWGIYGPLRKLIAITEESGGSYSGLPTIITIDYEPGMSSDFSDVRFAEWDGTTPIPFGLRSKVNGVQAKFIITRDYAPYSKHYVYLYYGKKQPAGWVSYTSWVESWYENYGFGPASAPYTDTNCASYPHSTSGVIPAWAEDVVAGISSHGVYQWSIEAYYGRMKIDGGGGEEKEGVQIRAVNNTLPYPGWTDPNNAFLDDDQCTYTNTDLYSNSYNFINNPFNIPAGAIIDGIEVRIRWGGDGDDHCYITLIDALGAGHTKYGTPPSASCANAVIAIGGGPADLWGGSWTAEHINSADFECHIMYLATGKASLLHIDYLEVKIYYHASNPVGAPWATTDVCDGEATAVKDRWNVKNLNAQTLNHAAFLKGQSNTITYGHYAAGNFAVRVAYFPKEPAISPGSEQEQKNSEALFAKFESQAIRDLFAEFEIQAIRDLFAKFYIGIPTASEDLFAKFEISIPSASANLKAIFRVIQWYDEAQDLFAKFEVRRFADLKAVFTVRHERFAKLKLFAKLEIRHRAFQDLKAEFWVGYSASQDLKAIFQTSTIWGVPLDLFSQFYVRTKFFGAELLEIEPARRVVIAGAVEEIAVGPGRILSVGPERVFSLTKTRIFKIRGKKKRIGIR